MAGGKSDYLEKRILDHFLGGVVSTAPANVFIALSTAVYSDAATGASMSEVPTAGSAYARVQVANTAAQWPAATGNSPATKSNASAVNFATATAAWGNIASFYVCDALTGGNVLYGADLATPKTVAVGDSVSFAPGGIVVTED